ncbi:MAG: hypothetical protein V3U75_05745 [Methylococcaceae bacterium]
MKTDKSNHDIYRLVVPVECETFIDVYCQQSEVNRSRKHIDIGNCFVQNESLSTTNKEYIPLGNVDCIVLHPTKIRSAYKHNPADTELYFNKLFIKKLYYALKPGAVIIIRGQIQIKLTMQGLLNLFSIMLEWLKAPVRFSSFSGYMRILKAQGFVNTRSFNVVSGWDNPFCIVSTDYTASKYFFSTYIESRRKEYTYLRYLFMKSLITLNIIRYLEGSFLVVAQK